MYNDDEVLGHSSGARPVHLSDHTVLAFGWSFIRNWLPTFAPSKKFKKGLNSFNCHFILITKIGSMKRKTGSLNNSKKWALTSICDMSTKPAWWWPHGIVTCSLSGLFIKLCLMVICLFLNRNVYSLTYLLTYLPTYLLTCLLTSWIRVLVEKLTGSELVKKFLAFHGARRFITAFTRARHLFLFWAWPIQSMSPPYHFLKIHFIVILSRDNCNCLVTTQVFTVRTC